LRLEGNLSLKPALGKGATDRRPLTDVPMKDSRPTTAARPLFMHGPRTQIGAATAPGLARPNCRKSRKDDDALLRAVGERKAPAGIPVGG